MKRITPVLTSVLLLLPALLVAKDPITVKKFTEPPKIDGRLDDKAWQGVPVLTGFKTFTPDYGKDMPFNTEVMMGYDEENLYYAFRCFDPDPSKIKVSVDSRDRIRQDDWVCVNLDSFNDQQSLYCIYSNANGIQMDTRYAAGKEDLGMDLVFYSAGSIDSTGYYIEIKLPLKSIRFTNREPVMMAVIFERHISRLSTQGTFPNLSADQGMAFLNQMQPFKYEGVKHYKLFEALPAVTYSYRGEQQSGKMTTTENKPDAGLTLKYGITSQLVLDAAINPDFSQVEADAGQVDANLRYELYYPEKRPFFQEGNENFQIGGSGSSVLDPIISFVNTRNIADPVAGLKLSGKAGSKNNIAVLYAADRKISEADNGRVTYGHYPVLRYKRSLKEDSYIGFLGTSVIDSTSTSFNYGADGNIRLNKSTLLDFHAILSRTNNLFFSPGKHNGHALGLNYHSEQRNIDYAFTAQDISRKFYSGAGFINRTGVTIFSAMATPRLYPSSKLIRRLDFEFFTGYLRDNDYDKWETYNSFSLISLLGGTIRTNTRVFYSTEIFSGIKFNTGGFLTALSGRIGTTFNGSLTYRRRASVIYSDLEQGYGNTLVSELRYLPTEKIHTQLNITYQNLYRSEGRAKVFDYLLLRGRLTYQVNKYLFFRAICEYNDYRESLSTDFLASFTYIPGTVFHIGYGSLYERSRWDGLDYIADERFLEMKRGIFMKFSYLFRV
ncbi:MAG: DUF5916 domain-containing protein [Bacteroidales bacterium]